MTGSVGGTSYPKSAAHYTNSATVNSRESFTPRRAKTLFDGVEAIAPGSLNDAAMIRSILVRSIQKSNKSRAQISDEITRYTGRKFSDIALNKFTAESRDDYRWPAELDRAFCAATGDDTLLIFRAELAGYHVITAIEAELLEIGREYLKQKRASERVLLLEKGLQGVEL